MTAVRIDSIKLDIEELSSLLDKATRQRVKDSLSIEIRKFETELINLQEKLKAEQAVKSNVTTSVVEDKPKGKTNVCYNVRITNYAWDQSDNFVKIYITLDNVGNVPQENVVSHFTKTSFEMAINGFEGKNHTLQINQLMHPIIPDSSYHKLKKDMVVIFMKKDGATSWRHLSVSDNKEKEPKVPKMDGDQDPSKGLMDMMKQMYDDGDDDMKRTIAKAWTESRDKQAMGMGADL